MSLFLSLNKSQFVLSSFLLDDNNSDNNSNNLRILLFALLLNQFFFVLLLSQRLFFNFLRKGQLSKDKVTICVASAGQRKGRRSG